MMVHVHMGGLGTLARSGINFCMKLAQAWRQRRGLSSALRKRRTNTLSPFACEVLLLLRILANLPLCRPLSRSLPREPTVTNEKLLVFQQVTIRQHNAVLHRLSSRLNRIDCVQ
jgi:hypothetical protein